MSRPFSSEFADGRTWQLPTGEGRPKTPNNIVIEAPIHRYAVSYVVLVYRSDLGGIFEFVDYGVSIEEATSNGRAIDAVFYPLTKKYKECVGYICRVKAEQIAD